MEVATPVATRSLVSTKHLRPAAGARALRGLGPGSPGTRRNRRRQEARPLASESPAHTRALALHQAPRRTGRSTRRRWRCPRASRPPCGSRAPARRSGWRTTRRGVAGSVADKRRSQGDVCRSKHCRSNVQAAPPRKPRTARGAHRPPLCPGRKPPFSAAKRPARPYKSPIQNGFP